MPDPLQLPALDTPPGVVSFFPTTHSDDQAWYYVCATLCAVVPGSLVLLRLYTKLRIVRKVDVTDGLAVSSFLFLIALLICGRLCLAEGAGVHQWNLPMHNYIGWLNIVEIVYAPTIFLVKTAILLQYLRLFAPRKTVNPFMWYSARIIIVVTAIYYTISTFISIFACSPREAIWDPLITDARCLDNDTVVFITSRAVWKLQIPIRRKVGIVLLFSIGLFACIANAMIMFYVSRVGGANADISYNTAWQGLWAFAEISFGIIVTCTLLLPKFLEAKGAKLRGVFSSLTRPFGSFGSGGSFGILMRSSKDKAGSREATFDRAVMVGRAESETSSTNRDQDIEMYPSYEGVHNPVEYPSKVADPTNRF
uniref:Putative ribosomal protein n=1 Tax=Cladonia uncialis subsp. uncialis TaxID=180999 RepID=A0A2K9YER4_CLAUC|nr:putative ribosomal protein [Cladonia uncialis subsp. uncialis]